MTTTSTTATARLLVVDDDPDILANFVDILVDMGYDVDAAPDGPSALELVESRRYDLVLMDLKMPDMDGLELYRRIRTVQAGAVAVVATAYATSETARQVTRAGAREILAKPVDLSRLIELVEDVLQQPLVVIADDDAEFCRTLWDVLQEHGYRACIAHDLDELSSRLAWRAYDVALIDMKLGESSGREVFQRIRERCGSTRALLMTGFRDEAQPVIEQTIEEGADAVLYKPLDIDELIRTLKKLAA